MKLIIIRALFGLDWIIRKCIIPEVCEDIPVGP